jgi:hypothetical protein
MDGWTAVLIATVAASLVLAVRAYRSHQLSFEKTAWMAVAWLLIIATLAFVLGRAGA